MTAAQPVRLPGPFGRPAHHSPGRTSDKTEAGPGAKMVDQWLVLRQAVRLAEAAEHPDLIDATGRRWTWKCGDTYRDKGSAYPRDMLPEPVVEVGR